MACSIYWCKTVILGITIISLATSVSPSTPTEPVSSDSGLFDFPNSSISLMTEIQKSSDEDVEQSKNNDTTQDKKRETIKNSEGENNSQQQQQQEKVPNDAPEAGNANHHYQHLRTSEHGIPVGEALDSPLCPPPPMTRSLGICYMEKCTTHHECSTGTACCFNGCIHTCIEPMDRPAAFDWTEDSSKILPILDMGFEESPHLFYPILVVNQPNSKYAAAEGGEELVHLPGGCFVSASRYQKLKEFMKAPSIKECRCNDGEVVCDVRAEQTATTEELF